MFILNISRDPNDDKIRKFYHRKMLVLNQTFPTFNIIFSNIHINEKTSDYFIKHNLIPILKKIRVEIIDIHKLESTTKTWSILKHVYSDDFVEYSQDESLEKTIASKRVTMHHILSMIVEVKSKDPIETIWEDYLLNGKNYSFIDCDESYWKISCKIPEETDQVYKINLWDTTLYGHYTLFKQREILCTVLSLRRFTRKINIKLPRYMLYEIIKWLSEGAILLSVNKNPQLYKQIYPNQCLI